MKTGSYRTTAVNNRTQQPCSDYDDYYGNGSAYIFERTDDGEWAELQQLKPSFTSSGRVFGASVAIRGELALVGAPGVRLNSFFHDMTEAAAFYQQNCLFNSQETKAKGRGPRVCV